MRRKSKHSRIKTFLNRQKKRARILHMRKIEAELKKQKNNYAPSIISSLTYDQRNDDEDYFPIID